ncbi:hypothetical protein DW2_04039 [Thioclava atlantica]|uniref:Uncharacterized protein n=1 Tax=Thioclava atlantica TaxID=1317124 RepID=A0A085U0F3_9RHOB|nr:hypothetical protein DW2_04039 [Thioclava atlantica]
MRKRARSDPMAAYDRLPSAARAWVARAALPWSAVSVARIWARALRETESVDAALARLDSAEARTLERDRMDRSGGCVEGESGSARERRAAPPR